MENGFLGEIANDLYRLALADTPDDAVARRLHVRLRRAIDVSEVPAVTRTFDNSVLVGVGLIAALLLFLPVIDYQNTRQLNEDARWVAHTHHVLDLTGDVMLALVDAETGQRGFLITGKDETLQPYDAALLRLDGLTAKLKDETKDNSGQQARITKLEEMTVVRLGQMKEAIGLRRKDEQAAQAFVLTGKPKAQMDAIRGHIAEMEQAEDDLLKERERKTAATYQVAVTTGLLTAVLGLVAVGVFVSLLNRSLSIRRQTEAALRASEAEFRAAFEHSAVGKAQLDVRSGRYLRVNAKFREMTGYSAEELAGMTPADLTFAEDRDAIVQALGRMRRGEVAFYEVEKRYVRKDGKLIWVNVNAKLLRAVEGHPEQSMAVIQDIIARKEAEEALRESEERYRATFASAPVGIAHVGLDGRWLRFNDAICAITGYGREKLATLTFADITHPEDLEADWAQAHRLHAGEIERYAMDKRCLRASGAVVWVNLTVSLLRDAEGAPVNFISVVQDITARKQTEEALRASEEFSRTVIESSPDCVKVLDGEGRLKFMNAQGRCLMEIEDSATLRDQPWSSLWPEAERPKVQAALARAKGGEVARFQAFAPTVKGVPKWWDVIVAPATTGDAGATQFVTVSRDITEQRQAERAVRESEERLRALTSAMPQLVWTCSRDGDCIFQSPQWEAVTGQPAADSLGYGWLEKVHPDDRERTADVWQKAVAERRGYEADYRLRSRDGTYRWFLARAEPLNEPSGEPSHWIGTSTDIHDAKETAEKLRCASEEVSRASRAKDDFLAALSHELRTPLTPVLMTATSLACDPSLPAEARDQLAMMRRNIELEARLIDDLLDLTRVSRGKLTIERTAADIHQLLAHTDEIVRSDTLGKQVRIEFHLEAARHHALCDPTRLQQVFWNLLKNAVKFTASGGTITIATRNDGHGRIAVSVADTGIGISATALPHVFNAFEQGDTAGQHRYGGLGLGLAIAQAIVKAHAGAIHAASEGMGCGATFTVTLATVDEPAISPQNGATPPDPARGLQLLILEDHDATRTALSRLLTRDGHTVTAASTIREARAAFEAAAFDAVISDLGLPDGSGVDFIREIHRQRPVPAIALTGYGMEEDVRFTKEAGFYAHLVKPVNLDHLRPLLRKLPVNGAAAARA